MIWALVYVGWTVIVFWLALRYWFRRFGPEWEGVCWAALGALPVLNLLTGIFFIGSEINYAFGSVEFPRWLARIGGVRA